MFLINWYRQWLDLKREYKSEPPCESCETLNRHIERLYFENDKLTQALINFNTKPTEVIEPADPRVQVPIRPRAATWTVRRQSLEENDRARAKSLRAAAQPATTTVAEETKELEKEMDIAADERESAAN